MSLNISTAAQKRWILTCVSGVSFMIMLDSNIVAISLPAIARSLHAGFVDVEWVVSGYILAFASCLMAAGSLADRFGRRRILMTGMAVFTLASLLCGLATSSSLLNAARAVQGVGAALQLSAAVAVLGHEFRGPERARAFATWGMVMGIAVASGPVIGGLVTSFLGWPWAFLVNVPIGTGLVWLAFKSVPESKDPAAQRLDYVGVVLLAGAIFSVVWGVLGATDIGWGDDSIRLRIIVGAVLLVAFIVAERLQSRPMIDLALFRRATFLGSAIAMFGYAASAQVMMTYLPLYLQTAYGSSAAQAGLRMLPFALPLFLCPRIAGRVSTRMSGRALLVMGLLIVCAGNLLTAWAVLSLDYWPVALCMVVVGCGAGLLNGETAKVQMASVPAQRAGMASGISTTTRFIGLLSGVAGLGSVLYLRLQHNFERDIAALGGLGVADIGPFAKRVAAGDLRAAAVAVPAGVRDAVVLVARAEFARSFSFVLVIAGVIAGLAAAMSWMLIRYQDTRPADKV